MGRNTHYDDTTLDSSTMVTTIQQTTVQKGAKVRGGCFFETCHDLTLESKLISDVCLIDIDQLRKVNHLVAMILALLVLAYLQNVFVGR